MPAPCEACKDTCGDGKANCGKDCKCGSDCKCSEAKEKCGCDEGGQHACENNE